MNATGLASWEGITTQHLSKKGWFTRTKPFIWEMVGCNPINLDLCAVLEIQPSVSPPELRTTPGLPMTFWEQGADGRQVRFVDGCNGLDVDQKTAGTDFENG